MHRLAARRAFGLRRSLKVRHPTDEGVHAVDVVVQGDIGHVGDFRLCPVDVREKLGSEVNHLVLGRVDTGGNPVDANVSGLLLPFVQGHPLEALFPLAVLDRCRQVREHLVLLRGGLLCRRFRDAVDTPPHVFHRCLESATVLVLKFRCRQSCHESTLSLCHSV